MDNRPQKNNRNDASFKKQTRKQLIIGGAIGAFLIIIVVSLSIIVSANNKPAVTNVQNDNTETQDNNESNQAISLRADNSNAVTTHVTVNGKDYKQIRIPVACNITPSDYTVDSSGYLRKSNGEKATGTLATTGATDKYTSYGSLSCITDNATLNYTLPNGYSFRNNLGTAYRVSNDENSNTLSVHIENLAVFADGSVGYALASDYQTGTSINILDENNKTVDVYYIKLNPQVTDNTGVQFLNDWKNVIDNKNSYSSSSKTSNSYSTSKTNWEAYCQDVFPGNDSYSKAARESCVRSAQASEDMANGKYKR